MPVCGDHDTVNLCKSSLHRELEPRLNRVHCCLDVWGGSGLGLRLELELELELELAPTSTVFCLGVTD